MPLTHFRFAWDGRFNSSMEVRTTLREPAAVEPCRSAHSANEVDDSFGKGLEHFWIDLGGEG